MYNLQIFQYKNNEDTQVAVITDQDGNILFDASHVCIILQHKNPSMAIKNLDEDEKVLLDRKDFSSDPKKSLGSLEGGAQQKWFIYESGLYKLIIRSNKPEAKAFTRWITHEVLPSIRKSGGYSLGNTVPDMVAINKTHKAAYDLAIREGGNKIEARKKATDVVKEVHGVDVYKLLGIEAPKDETQHHPTPDKRIVEYMQRKGLQAIKVRDICRAGIPGNEHSQSAKLNMQSLVDTGQAVWIANTLLQMVNWQKNS